MTSTLGGAPHASVHRGFESSGCLQALRRLVELARNEERARPKKSLAQVPNWIFEPNFKHACSRTTVRDCLEYTRRFCRLRAFLKAGGAGAELSAAEEEDAVRGLATMVPSSSVEHAVAIARVALGAALELMAAIAATRLCPAKMIPTSSRDVAMRLARVQSDAYFAAVWTDAHSNYALNVVFDGASVTYLQHDPHIDFGAPSIRRTVSMSTLPDVAAKFEKFNSSAGQVDAASKDLLCVLFRCAQSGSRGWDASLTTALGAEGSLWVLQTLFKACLVGMHPQIHPAARPDWGQRAVILRLLDAQLSTATLTKVMKAQSNAIKECVRLYIATLLNDTSATRTALARTTNSLGVLRSAPIGLAPSTLLATAQMLANVGLDVGTALSSRPEGGTTASDLVIQCLAARLTLESRARANGGASKDDAAAASNGGATSGPTGKRAVVLHSSEVATAALKALPAFFNPAWFGRAGSTDDACSAVELLPNTSPQNSLNCLAVCHELVTRAFRAQFVPFWLHGHGNSIRASRFDEAQFKHMLQKSALNRLLSAIDEPTMLRVQRVAMRSPTASTATVAQVGVMLRLPEADQKKLNAAKTGEEAISAVTTLTPHAGAALLFFGRVTHLKNRFLTFSLGERTRLRQLYALKLRFELDTNDPDEILAQLPMHAHRVFSCLECRRCPNAIVDDKSKMVSHNEVGLAQTMLRVGGVGDAPQIRCARRSSAALRTAITKEELAMENRIEAIEVDDDAIERALTDSGDVAHAARLRRDLRTCAEQHAQALACGDRPLINISLIGKVVRLNNRLYAICSFCGAIVVVNQLRRFEGEICCCRCDASMLRLQPPIASQARRVATEVDTETKRPPPPPLRLIVPHEKLNCRYCNRAPPSSASASKFRVLRAPTDSGGRNAGIPPPLRVAAFCGSHWRPWLETGLRQLPIAVVFAHIAEKAAPVFGAETGRRNLAIEHKTAAAKSTKTQKAILKRVRENRTKAGR